MHDRMGRRRRRLALIAIAGAVCTPGAAVAEPAHIFRLPAEPVEAALLRFGVQAGVSVGGACPGRSRPLVGVFTPSAALGRLLPAGCTFTRIDARAFRIDRAAAPPPQPPVAKLAQAAAAVDIAELVVTAEKRREPLRGSPFAVSAVDRGEIERLGATGVSELALQFAGVTETNLGPGRNKLFIRGISDGAFTGRTQSTVGLYLDDSPITYNAPDPDLRLADVERVEVLRGPQGTLYGSGSIGGIVRLVTSKPDVTGFAGRIVAETGLVQHGGQGFGGEAMFNAPLADGRAAVRGVVYAERMAGYLDNPGLGLRDTNRGRRTGGRLSGLAELPGQWTAQATVALQFIKTDDSQYIQGSAVLARDTHVREPHDNDFALVSGRLAHAGSTANVSLSAAYIDHNLASRYDATGAFDLRPDQVAAFDEDQRARLLFAEVVASSASETRLRWLIGAFASHTRERSDGQLDATLPSGGARSVFQRRDHLTEAAIFGELTFDVTDRLTATVGARGFATWVDTSADGFGLARGALGPIRGEDRDAGFAPKVRLAYALSPDIVLYAQAQDGFRAGGFNVPAAADGVAGGPTVAAFNPDRLRSYEVGGEATVLDRRLTIRLAAYRARWRNVQTDQFRDSGLPLTLNIGDGANLGLEAEAEWRPDAHWRLRLSGLANEPELIRADAAFPARVDIGLPGVARRSGSFDIAYRWPLTKTMRAEFSGQAAYVGRSFLTFDGAAASAMGNYGQARLAASLTGAGWQAQAYLSNLTDARGDTFAFGNPFSRMRTRQATPLEPRSFGLALRRSF